MSDDPERLLSGAQTGIPDTSDGEWTFQLRASKSVFQLTAR